MQKRVLILSAGVGSGHISAAAAIERALAGRPDVEVRNQDALKLTSRIYQVTAADAYFALVRESPWLVGWWYDQNDEPFRAATGATRLWHTLNGQPLVDMVQEYAPDITVCTHFFPAGMVAQLLSEERLQTRLSIVTTDYDFQGMWLSRIFHRYFVALEETKVHLASFGVEPERITVSGIPVNPVLAEPVDRDAILERYGLRPDLPTILVSAGALGGGPAAEIVAQILQMRVPAQTLVVCGRNRALRNSVTALTAAHAGRFRVLGYTSEMPDLMRVASIFVGKPGGLTSAECMAAGLPMLIIQPIPGQEERNADHLLESGAAVRCRSLGTVAYKLDAVLGDPERLARMREGAARLGRPDAAAVVAETILNDVEQPQVFSREELRRIVAAARGEESSAELEEEREPEADQPSDDAPIALYDDDTGVYIGAINQTQLQFLHDQLEEEGDDDDAYYVDQPTLDLLADRGGDADLINLLRAALAERGHLEVRFVQP